MLDVLQMYRGVTRGLPPRRNRRRCAFALMTWKSWCWSSVSRVSLCKCLFIRGHAAVNVLQQSRRKRTQDCIVESDWNKVHFLLTYRPENENVLRLCGLWKMDHRSWDQTEPMTSSVFMFTSPFGGNRLNPLPDSSDAGGHSASSNFWPLSALIHRHSCFYRRFNRDNWHDGTMLVSLWWRCSIFLMSAGIWNVIFTRR